MLSYYLLNMYVTENIEYLNKIQVQTGIKLKKNNNIFLISFLGFRLFKR